MKVETNKVVAITYMLSAIQSDKSAELLETVEESQPFYFLVGNSGLPPKFELNLMGKLVGEKFDFEVNVFDAFGPRDHEDVIDLPLNDFLDDNKILDKQVFQVGRLIPLVDEHGMRVPGRIIEINEHVGYVRMDLNHPLAGKDLRFEGKIMSIREATPDEIAHGHVHGEGGYSHG